MAVVIAEKQAALLGNRIAAAMHEAVLSPAELAKRSWVPLPIVHKIVAGEGTQVSIWTVWRLAETLDLSLDYLAGRTTEPRVCAHVEPVAVPRRA